MRNLDRLLLAHFLPKLLGRACPATVCRSGAEGMRVNCFNTTIREGDEPTYVLLKCRGSDVEALKYDGQRYATPTTIALESIDPSRVQVTHFYGLDEVRYDGIRNVALGLWVRRPYAQLHLRRLGDAIAQQLFNRRTLEVRRRLDVLRDVVGATIGGADSIDALDLMSARYGARWAGHPGWEAHHRLLERHLDLLVQSGELEKCGHGYSPTGFALKTLDESEDEDRKHSANLRVQLLLAVLTLVSAVMAAAQAGLVKLPTLVDFTEARTKTTTARPLTSPSSAEQQPGSAAVSTSAPGRPQAERALQSPQ